MVPASGPRFSDTPKSVTQECLPPPFPPPTHPHTHTHLQLRVHGACQVLSLGSREVHTLHHPIRFHLKGGKGRACMGLLMREPVPPSRPGMAWAMGATLGWFPAHPRA